MSEIKRYQIGSSSTGGGAVDSVNGETGAVVIDKTDVGLGNVDNTSDAAKPVSTAQQTALDTKQFAPPSLASGSYFYTSSPNNVNTSNVLGVGTLRLVPWVVHRTMTLARIGADIATAGEAGSKFRIAIYGDNGSTNPGSLVLDAGQINGDSATVQELTISQTLTPGLYWVGGVVQAVTTTQPTVRIVNVTSWAAPVLVSAGLFIPGTGGISLGISATGVTGAAPANFPAGSGASLMPRIFARTA